MNTKTRHTSAADTTEAVEALLKSLAHPMKAEIQLIRAAILGADPNIKEGVKWNAPSFRTHEYFATTNLREKDGIGLILHLGAKMRDVEPGSLRIEDAAGMLKWLAADRAMVKFVSAADLEEKKLPFIALIPPGSGMSEARPKAFHWRARPNPSRKRIANGRPPGPDWWYEVHVHQPGPGVLPASPA